MRGLVGLILEIGFLGIGMIVAASPASAQRYDPSYPVCMEVYDSDGSRMECFYTSMAQCKEGAGSGVAGVCLNNPYYKAPPPQPAPVAETAPAPVPTAHKTARREAHPKPFPIPAQKQP